jgi:hypothetical protein
LRALTDIDVRVVIVSDIHAAYDGAAVDLGIPTLLLPPLRSAPDRRLRMALSAVTQPGE